MDVKGFHGDILNSLADTLIVNLFEGVSSLSGATGAVDRALGGAISELIAGGDFKGKLGESAVLYPRGALPAQRVILTGLGKAEKFDLEAVRKAAATAIKKARDLNARDVATIVHGSGIGGLPVGPAAQATVEGSLLALYRYQAPRHSDEPLNELSSLTIVEREADKISAVEAALATARASARGVYLARDLVNLPPNVATPTRLAESAGEIASEFNMALTVGDREWAAGHKMGAFLAVAKGAGEPPKFIVLEHNSTRTDLDTIVLVGKGITFDTGGISLKPSERMGEMKSDMGGAAAVLGTMLAIGELNLPLRVIGIAPATENMPDAQAYHPADVITASNGKTIEIISTDAEGRMILADALVYAGRYRPKAVIDLATLTGACVVALGDGIAAGLFTDDENLRLRLTASGKASHERVWSLPLWDDYKKKIKSDVADMQNTGGRYGGVGSSAIFLKEFTEYPWVHLDIAPMALSTNGSESNPYIPLGGTGYGVRLLVDFLSQWGQEIPGGV